MPAQSDIQAREAKWGEKMIEIRVRFWTNDIADNPEMIIPKHAWSSGVVMMESNKAHDVVPENPVPFHTLMDLPAVMEKVLIKQDITLHASRRAKKYFKTK